MCKHHRSVVYHTHDNDGILHKLKVVVYCLSVAEDVLRMQHVTADAENMQLIRCLTTQAEIMRL